MKIDSAAVCGFIFLNPVGHVQDTLLLIPACLQRYCDEGSNPDEDDNSASMFGHQQRIWPKPGGNWSQLLRLSLN